MRVTSLKDMDSYIYSTVVLPLKELDVASLNISSPITDERGRAIELYVNREETGHRHYDHNFLRDEARNNSLSLVWCRHGSRDFVVADYDRHKHKVNVYTRAFEAIPNGKYLLNKLLQAFNNYTPFTGVELKEEVRDGYSGGYDSSSRHSDSDDSDDSEDEDWLDD